MTILCSLLAAFVFITMVWDEKTVQETIKLGLCSGMGISLFFAIELFNERAYFSKWILPILGLIFLVAFYYLNETENEFGDNKSFVIRFGVTAACFHLLVSFLPYLRSKDSDAFWQYNKTLFLAIFTSALYTLTLAGGLCLAVLAIDQLFDLKVDYHWYGTIWAFCIPFVNTCLFLNNIPELREIDQDRNFPKALKLFTQYVLLPLVAIYVLILLSYEIKIIAIWSLPKGWVSNLVLASAVFGILAFLLLYPIKHITAWISRFSQVFYWILLPLIVLMAVAIYVRISQYGITELRYIVAMLTIWLLGISLYFIVSKVDNIKVIPISLFLVGMLSVYGPLSGFASAYRNQTRRMNHVLEKNKLLKDGLLTSREGLSLDDKSTDMLSAAFDYLSENKPETFKNLLTEKGYKEYQKLSKWDRENFLWKTLKLKKEERWRENEQYNRAMDGPQKAYRADYLLQVAVFDRDTEQTFKLENDTLTVKRNSETSIQVKIANEELNFDLSSILENHTEQEDFIFKASSERFEAIFVLNSMWLNKETKDGSMDGNLFLIKK